MKTNALSIPLTVVIVAVTAGSSAAADKPQYALIRLRDTVTGDYQISAINNFDQFLVTDWTSGDPPRRIAVVDSMGTRLYGNAAFPLQSGWDLNDFGDVVGRVDFEDVPKGGRVSIAAAFAPGVVHILDCPVGTRAQADGINAQRHIIGRLWDHDGTRRTDLWAARWRGATGSCELLPDDGHETVYANAINDHGVICGEISTNPIQPRAVLWDNLNQLIDLTDLTGIEAQLTSINNLGDVTGDSLQLTADGWAGFVYNYQTGETWLIEPLAGLSSVNTADINNLRQVVGYSNNIGDDPQPFIWTQDGGTRSMGALLPPRSRFNPDIPTGINDNGLIVVLGRNADDSYEDVLLLPVHPTMHLAEPFPGRSGLINTMVLDDAEPLASVSLYYSFQGGGAPIAGCDRMQNMMQIERPVLVETKLADEQGSVTFEFTVPSSVHDRGPVVFQAVQHDHCTISDVVEYRFKDE